MSYLVAALGFMALVVFHELGHFFAAKAVGMRVERFSLFFPPFAYRKQGKGETEYTIGMIPLGGYVKISGMNPHEELPPEVEHRAYYKQKPWKRIVVILAGPLVNIVIAFVLLTGLAFHTGVRDAGTEVTRVEANQPATGILQPGDRIVAVDGERVGPVGLREAINSHRCAGDRQINGCKAATPAVLTIIRDGEEVTERITPVLSVRDGERAMRVGFFLDYPVKDANVITASDQALDNMWFVIDRTVTVLGGLYKEEVRSELSGVVGSYETTRQAVNIDLETTLRVLALISLSLGFINLLPFLPLDGGHVFWAVAEKIRGKAISFTVMERSGLIGFALVGVLFLIGFTNDLNRLFGEGFQLQR